MRPRSSTRRTMPVAFMAIPPCFSSCRASICRKREDMRENYKNGKRGHPEKAGRRRRKDRYLPGPLRMLCFFRDRWGSRASDGPAEYPAPAPLGRRGFFCKKRLPLHGNSAEKVGFSKCYIRIRGNEKYVRSENGENFTIFSDAPKGAVFDAQTYEYHRKIFHSEWEFTGKTGGLTRPGTTEKRKHEIYFHKKRQFP